MTKMMMSQTVVLCQKLCQNKKIVIQIVAMLGLKAVERNEHTVRD